MFTYLDSFYLRSPSRPITTLQETLSVFDKDFLSLIADDDLFLRAIYLSSRDLYMNLNDYNSLSEKNRIKVKLSLLKYLIRFHFRCTPYGLFAGGGVGKINDHAGNISIRDDYNHFRIDLNVVGELISKVNKEGRHALTYYSNNSLYKSGDHLRYIESLLVKNRLSYQLCSVEINDYILQVLHFAKSGKPYKEIAKSLISEDISKEDAMEFVDGLIEEQLLVSELNIKANGDSPLSLLTEKINQYGLLEPEVKTINNNVNRINTSTPTVEECETINVSIYDYLGTEKVMNNLNCDTYISVSGFLPSQIANEVCDAIQILSKLSKKPESGLITKFSEAFFQRYEYEEVPLLQALDVESGIGFPVSRAGEENDINPLIDKIRTDKQTNNEVKITEFDKKLINKISRNEEEIVLTKSDLLDIEKNDAVIPNTFCSIFEVYTKGKEEYDIFLKEAGGSSSINILARFSNNQDVLNWVKEINQYDKEVGDNSVLAEISHIPEGRVGNVIQKPIVRDIEIPILSLSDLDEENVIQLSDIYVKHKQGSVDLFSKKLDKSIIPVLTNSHNFLLSDLTIYKFLSEYQNAIHTTYLLPSFHNLENLYNYLPRIRFGNIILSLRKWKVTLDDLKIHKDFEEAKSIITNYFQKESIPLTIVLVNGDNKLLLDLTNNNFIRIFIQEIKKHKNVVLEEFYEPEDYIVKDSQGNGYNNEFIMSFVKRL
ncbi:lantibiotic dehydratase family protein [Flammeovirga aprica]|uniref:Lantibiotic dehydratase N-terminal domain-containing protein n=1 Tax=Flammeovirga aprica JL-4 TaxID=694437 RepID=A0A7X9P186_9BACT|nr:lantibiotic dehydratase family protein [Flammeovirga aprica]NME66794.1 hypothetical protein [Flammeovirga aprica JL-4]